MASTTNLPNASLSWSRNRRTEQRIQASDTLDLHGYTREDAIRAVTKFWEDAGRKYSQNPWVCVITGTGAHSGALGGPILKQAIHKLLIKRQMEFSYCKKPRGMFLVNVRSGIVLKHNPSAVELLRAAGDTTQVVEDAWNQDTKVKVVQREHIPGATAPRLPAQKKKATGKKARKDAMNYAQASVSGPQHERLNTGPAPRPSELAADQRMLDQAKTASLKYTRKYQSQRDKEENMVREAMQKTEQEALEEQRLEEEELNRILALSQEEHQQHQTPEIDEEAELERILQLSLEESQKQPPMEDSWDEAEWQKALSQSNLEYNHTERERGQQQDEEAELERALRMSMAETQQPASTPDQEENDEMQRVTRMPMAEAAAVPEQADIDEQSYEQGVVIEEEVHGEQPPYRELEIESPMDTEPESDNPQPTAPQFLSEMSLPQEELQGACSATPSLVASSYSGMQSSVGGDSYQSFSDPKPVDAEANVEAPVAGTSTPTMVQNVGIKTFGADQSLGRSKPNDQVVQISKLNGAPLGSQQEAGAFSHSPSTTKSLTLQPSQQQAVPTVNTTVPPPPPAQGQESPSPAGVSQGELLLESILYKKPLPLAMQPFHTPLQQEAKKTPQSNSSIHFNLDSPTRSNLQQQTLVQPTLATSLPQQPVLLQAVLEHRLMEILQRPIALAPPRQTSVQPTMTTTTSLSTTSSLSASAACFTPTMVLSSPGQTRPPASD